VELPRAVASGSAGDGAPDDRVRAGRVAAVAGALAAAYVLALAVVRPAPQWIASLVGGPSGVERFGGLRMHWQGADGSIVPIERTGVSEAYAAEVVERFGGGGIEFREVIESDAAPRSRVPTSASRR